VGFDPEHGVPLRPPLLIVKSGTTDPPVVATHGDYDDWFIARLVDGPSRCTVVPVHAGAPLPSPLNYAGVLVTGSPLSVRDEAPWMAAMGHWMLATAGFGIPVFAICFGHQVLGEVLGGRVETNPAGRELGTVTVETTAAGRADPLFLGLGDTFDIQATHGDALMQAPTDPRVVRLAGNANTTWQALAVGPRIRAVQFHPELPHTALNALLENRGQAAHVHPCPAGPRMLQNWDEHWVCGGSVR
jgi:GMP synthase (glutamine-hydrolysing)